MAQEEWLNSRGESLFENIKLICSTCKSQIKNPIICSENSWHWFGKGIMCKKCAKKCQTCKKFFCLKHLKKHSCSK
jgi:hypothetical protein